MHARRRLHNRDYQTRDGYRLRPGLKVPLSELLALEAEVSAELADKRERMSDATHERVSGHLVDKRLRERFGIPRLSLFYT